MLLIRRKTSPHIADLTHGKFILIDPTRFIQLLFETFDRSAIDDFRAFLSANERARKWQVAADFCLHDKNRPNNVFAFTIIPYDAYPDTLFREIRHALPKDLKKTKTIDSNAIEFLTNQRRFHFGFVFQDPPAVFNNGPGSDSLTVARESLAITVDTLVKHGRSKENMRRLKILRQKAQATAFDVELLADMYVLSYLLCFVTLLLSRECRVDVVGWFSDRDKMTTCCDGVVWDISRETLYGLANHFRISIPNDIPLIAKPDANADKDGTWFDEFVRLPDYIAGVLAAWNLTTNELPGDKDKHIRLAEDVIANARNMAILKVRWSDCLQCSRVIFRRAPSNIESQSDV